MTVIINGQTQIKSQTLVNFPPQPALNLNFTQGYANGLNPLPSTVTFTRADSAAVATQVGPDGLLRLAAHNTLTYSQDFSNAAWSLNFANTSLVSSTAPDGSIGVYQLYPNSSTNYVEFYRLVSPTPTAGVAYAMSVYVKSNGKPFVAIGTTDVATVWFNLLTGNVGTQTSGLTGSINSVGNGWYRCCVSFVASGTAVQYTIQLTDADNSHAATASGSSGIYVWGAQFERNLTPSYYVPTTTAAVYANTPRFDYDPVTTEPKGLLIEEARTNVLTYSNTFSNGVWVPASGASISSGSVSPDGTNNAWTYTNPSSGLETYYFQNYASGVAGTTYTFSVFMKRGTERYGYLILVIGSSRYSILVDLETGLFVNGYDTSTPLTNKGYSIVSAGNGWYRISVTGANASSGNVYGVFENANTSFPVLTTGGNDIRYPSFTYGGTVLVYGAQLEVGSFPTSYIPTVASSVTRAVESATMTGTNFSSWWNATNGTFLAVADSEGWNSSDVNYIFSANSLTPGSTAVNMLTNLVGNAQFRVWASSSIVGDVSLTRQPLNTLAAYAGVYKTDDYSAAVKGVLGTPDLSGTMGSGINQLVIGGASGSLNGHLAKIQYWPARFSDAQLQLITKG